MGCASSIKRSSPREGEMEPYNITTQNITGLITKILSLLLFGLYVGIVGGGSFGSAIFKIL